MMLPVFDSEDTDIIMTLARELTGTNVNQTQHSVIIQNVASRVNQVKCDSLSSYLEYVDTNGEEMSHLLSAVTIHTTSWFREIGAFEKLEEIVQQTHGGFSIKAPFRVLSIACSTGEEVYSIASVLERFRSLNSNFEYLVEGWDIDPISMRTARSGVFDAKAYESIPIKYRSYIASERSVKNGEFQVSSTLKDRCQFKAVNIVKPPLDIGLCDYVICRNMLIYFKNDQVAKIIQYIKSHLRPSGHLCIGVSETSAANVAGLNSIGGATYRHIEDQPKKQSISTPSSVVPKTRNGEKVVLVIDDDSDARKLMAECLTESGYTALSAKGFHDGLSIAAKNSIDLILSDFNMPPGPNGMELCKAIRNDGRKMPFVLVSGFADTKMVENSVAVGCNDVVLKPLIGNDLVRLVKSYIGAGDSRAKTRPTLIAIGASTGGTEVIAKFVANLPSNCPPVVVVQHITTGFAGDFARRLAQISNLKLGEMRNDEIIKPGHIYIALGDYHIGVKQVGSDLKLVISNEAPISSHRPSVDFLFGSVATTRQKAFAALFTGMGRDGAQGLLSLRNQGAETCAQNEETCVVFGMPKEAIKLNAAIHIAAPQNIRQLLNERLELPPESTTQSPRKTN